MPMRTNDPGFSWIVSDINAKPILKLKNYHKRVNGSGGIWKSPLYVFNDKAHFMEYGSDTIFILKEKLPEPYALINMGGMKMDPDPKLTLNTRETIDRLNKKLWLRVINENFRYLFITSWWGFTDSTNYCIFNKQTLETKFISKDGFFNDLDGVVSFWPKYIYKDSILVDYIDAFKLLSIMDKRRSVTTKENGRNTSDQLGLLCKQLDKTSNPVLIVLNE